MRKADTQPAVQITLTVPSLETAGSLWRAAEVCFMPPLRYMECQKDLLAKDMRLNEVNTVRHGHS